MLQPNFDSNLSYIRWLLCRTSLWISVVLKNERETTHTNTPVMFRTACQRVHGNPAMLHIWNTPQKDPHQIMQKLNISALKFGVVNYRKIRALRFLGAFAKLRKATVSFIMSVRPSEWNNSAPNKRIFMKCGIWIFFEITSRTFTFHWNLSRITGTLHKNLCTFGMKSKKVTFTP